MLARNVFSRRREVASMRCTPLRPKDIVANKSFPCVLECYISCNACTYMHPHKQHRLRVIPHPGSFHTQGQFNDPGLEPRLPPATQPRESAQEPSQSTNRAYDPRKRPNYGGSLWTHRATPQPRSGISSSLTTTIRISSSLTTTIRRSSSLTSVVGPWKIEGSRLPSGGQSLT
jgi:hypothetical protein